MTYSYSLYYLFNQGSGNWNIIIILRLSVIIKRNYIPLFRYIPVYFSVIIALSVFCYVMLYDLLY